MIDHKFIGKEYPVTEYEIGREKMKEYASAVNDSNLYYHDKEFGKKSRYVGVLKPAEAPTGAGLWYMDTSSAAAEAVTLWAAAGFVAHFFPTGQGNIIGNAILPTIKLTANPLTARTMSEHVDYDCSAILRGEMTLDQSGDNLLEMLRRTCNGRLTAQEVLGHEEFVLTKLYRSA